MPKATKARTYSHKNTTVTFDAERAHFYAIVKGGIKLDAPSLDAMRKKIDAALAIAFEPFKAFVLQYHEYEPTTVTSVGRGTSYRRGERVFHTEDGHERPKLTPDTPANRKLIAAYHEAKKKGDAEVARINANIAGLRDAVPLVSAEAFAATVKKAV